MAGDTFKPRPTIYKGIKMRSRLEAGFAQWLDEDLFRWQYEPFAVADGTGQYLPDFLIENLFFAGWGRVVRAVVEVKPPSFDLTSEEGARLARAMTVAHHNLPDSVLLVCQPGAVTPIAPGCPQDCGEDHEPFGCWTPRYLGPYTWISMAPGSVPDAGLTGLARAMPPFGCPWAGDYWRVD